MVRTARRCAIVAGSVVVSVVALAPPASGAGIGEASVTGPVTGVAPFTFGAPCGFAHQQYTGTVDGAAGDATFFVDGCAEFGTDGFTFTGTFAIDTPKGSVSGAATGTIEVSAPRSHVVLDLRATSATRAMHSLHRPMLLDVAWITDSAGGSVLEGDLTVTR
jgi:hypothetical protein